MACFLTLIVHKVVWKRLLGLVGFLITGLGPTANLLGNQPVKDFGKSFRITWQRYNHEYGVSLLGNTVCSVCLSSFVQCLFACFSQHGFTYTVCSGLQVALFGIHVGLDVDPRSYFFLFLCLACLATSFSQIVSWECELCIEAYTKCIKCSLHRRSENRLYHFLNNSTRNEPVALFRSHGYCYWRIKNHWNNLGGKE